MSNLPSSRRIPRKWIFLAVFLLLVGAYFAYRAVLHARVDAEIANIRAEGYPTNGEELEAYYPEPPPGQNAATIYMDAFAKLDTTVPDEDKDHVPVFGNPDGLPPVGETMPEDMKKAIDRFLAKNKEAMNLFHQAARKPACRYPVRLQDGFAADRPELVDVRQSFQILDVAIARSLEDNSMDAALSQLMDMYRLAQSLKNEPALISQLVRYSAFSYAIQATERFLSRSSFAESQLRALASALYLEEDSRKYARGLAGERAMALILFRSGESLYKNISVPHHPPELHLRLKEHGYRASGLYEMDQIAHLNALDDAIRSTQDPSPRRRLDAAERIGSRLSTAPTFRILIHQMLGLWGAINQDIRAIAFLRSARTAIAVEQHRLATGTLPAKLSDLLPDLFPRIPDDPYTDPPIPLRYLRRVKGYVVYSVGRNGTDDGGDKEDQRDVTFEVAR